VGTRKVEETLGETSGHEEERQQQTVNLLLIRSGRTQRGHPPTGRSGPPAARVGPSQPIDLAPRGAL